MTIAQEAIQGEQMVQNDSRNKGRNPYKVNSNKGYRKADKSVWDTITSSQLGNPNEVQDFVPQALATYSRHELLGVWQQMRPTRSEVIEPVISTLPVEEVKNRINSKKILRSTTDTSNLCPEFDKGGITLMLKNIPNKYTREQLVQEFWKQVGQTFDFVYLPIDFTTLCNIGYCFINFRTMEAARDFTNKFHQVHTRDCLPGFNSNKVCVVSAAAVQGSKATMAKLSPSILPLLTERPEWQPVLFDFNQTRDVAMGTDTWQPVRSDFGDCTFFSHIPKPPDTPPKIEETESGLDEVPPPPLTPSDGREIVSLSEALPLVDGSSSAGQSMAMRAKHSLIRCQVEKYMQNQKEHEIAIEDVAAALFAQASMMDMVISLTNSQTLRVAHTIQGSMIQKVEVGAEL